MINLLCQTKIHEDENYLNCIDLDEMFFGVLDVEDCQPKVACDPLVDQLNKLAIDDEFTTQSWNLFRSQRGGYKLCSMGFSYTIDKPKLAEVPNASKIYWKCSDKFCPGRAISNGLNPPLKFTQSIIREVQLGVSDECVSMLKKDAIRQLIRRERSKAYLTGFNAKSLSQLTIPESLSFTYKNKKFFYYDSGSSDKNRILIFTTEENLKLLSKYNDWYAYGTFDVSPTLFKQVYSIHIIINETALPMLYTLLPKKKQVTYKKLFRVINELVTISPNSINLDFEIAAINAIKIVFKCKVYACYFHLCQSLWRRVQSSGQVKRWFDENFRVSFRRLQALAFIPVCDIIEGFEYIKQTAPCCFSNILNYFENNYIGHVKNGVRGKPRFDIELWNLFDRVKKDIPRTNNDVENWHSRIKFDARQNLTVSKVVELFRLEQNFTETNLVNLFNEDVLKKNKKKC
ncbi:unnamed protein product [Brachionus calyciflorus]|uniref:FLYWCH-type domain-containing protein n=1 Tax=Brachionus calyciflorus TaxID=104777 RepID=A0A814L4F3_9BILA|nr:unnamed protein product [Brachionus calyciflorus]